MRPGFGRVHSLRFQGQNNRILVRLKRGYVDLSFPNGFGHLDNSRGSCIEDLYFSKISLATGLCFGPKGA